MKSGNVGPMRTAVGAGRSAVRSVVIFVTLGVVLSPFLLVIYRLSIFNTVPRDDYAGFLLWLAGNPQGSLPPSPYCYRLLSMVAALPFYGLAPAPHLTNLPGELTPVYQNATFALSLMAYACSIATLMLGSHMAEQKGGLSKPAALLSSALLVALEWYTQITAIDTLAIMLITAGLCLVHRPLAFSSLILLSALTNEKIVLVLALWLSVRCILHADGRSRLWRQWIASLAGLALYAVVVTFAHLPGNAYQVDPSSFSVTAFENIAAYFSGRGLLLNVLPIVVLSGLAINGMQGAAARSFGLWFRPSDLLIIPGLMVVALLFTHLFQAGRIVMHAAPIFVVPAISGILRLASRDYSADIGEPHGWKGEPSGRRP